jgi:hypothetical protein
MATCRVCGCETSDYDDVTVVGGSAVHTGCVEAHKEPKRRRIGSWAAMGSRGQMAMGAVQQDSRPD